AFIEAGFADELLVYVAPTLLGGARLALGDLGVASIDAALRYHFAVVERLGDDVLLVAHPISSPASRDSTTAQERN
ncbi:MAG TPA: dihydrofolate reductase family protein, partial [Agromyces sp.]|nr:dihydrofolate reductase family protein [Agromyces sp.]